MFQNKFTLKSTKLYNLSILINPPEFTLCLLATLLVVFSAKTNNY